MDANKILSSLKEKFGYKTYVGGIQEKLFLKKTQLTVTTSTRYVYTFSKDLHEELTL